MNTVAAAFDSWEVVIPQGDLTIPAAELIRHGLHPGAHLRLVPIAEAVTEHRSVRGVLADKVSNVPTWDDFEAIHREVANF